jgi:hypothetical protein
LKKKKFFKDDLKCSIVLTVVMINSLYCNINTTKVKTGANIKHVTPAKHVGFLTEIRVVTSFVGGVVLRNSPPLSEYPLGLGEWRSLSPENWL